VIARGGHAVAARAVRVIMTRAMGGGRSRLDWACARGAGGGVAALRLVCLLSDAARRAWFAVAWAARAG
jgi:hypothetical protein